MIKYLAILCKNGRGKVLNVAEGEIRRVVAKEESAGSTIVGEYSDPRHAAKAVTLGLKGWRVPSSARKTA